MFLYSKYSSAKSLTCDGTVDGKSFIWHKKRSGPKTVPCSTQESTVHDVDMVPSMITCYLCCVRKVFIQSCMFSVMPYCCDLCRNVLCGTVSHSLLKSKIIISA
jgi:hypothetical protein